MLTLTEVTERVGPAVVCWSLPLACATDCRSPGSPAVCAAVSPPADSRSR